MIVDDNQELLIALKVFLSGYFEKIRGIKNPNLIPGILEEEDYDLILLDMNFSAGISRTFLVAGDTGERSGNGSGDDYSLWRY